MKTLYTAHATSVGGRSGHVETDDKNLALDLASPGAPNTKPGNTNPEQLFACGYAACFGSALDHVAKSEKVEAKEIKVIADVSLNQDDSGYSIGVTLNITLDGVDSATAQKLVEAAHQVCPYSKATRGNVNVVLKVNNKELMQAA
jgi:osmotically inducible protein OsmC